jgi:hypothetical protein
MIYLEEAWFRDYSDFPTRQSPLNVFLALPKRILIIVSEFLA